MALEKVIFDSTVFNYFLRIQTVNFEIIIRSLIRDKVLIPSQIVIEMEHLARNEPHFKSKIAKWIDLSHRNSFYHYCDTFDSIVFDSLIRRLDFGEAGAIAQAEKTNVFWFISDDIKNYSFVNQNFSHIRQHTIFFLVALADVSGLLQKYEYERVLIDILYIRKYKEFTPGKKKKIKAMIRSEYNAAIKLKGLHYYKKLVSQKTSIDTILKNKNIIANSRYKNHFNI
jgi:predicted nucleic acid-binding protein